MNNANEKQFAVGRWAKATFWGWMLGVALILLLSSFLDSIGIQHMQFYLGVGMGAGVGFFQWRLLKKMIAVNTNWIWSTVIGMGVPFVVIDLTLPENIAYKLPLGIAIGSLAVGLLQFFLLKKFSEKAFLWFWGCIAGWTLSVVTVNAIDYTMRIKVTGYMNLVLALLNLILILAGGVVLGVISGLAMKRVLEA